MQTLVATRHLGDGVAMRRPGSGLRCVRVRDDRSSKTEPKGSASGASLSLRIPRPSPPAPIPKKPESSGTHIVVLVARRPYEYMPNWSHALIVGFLPRASAVTTRVPASLTSVISVVEKSTALRRMR